MFRGVNPINLDAKGRMALPARYRESVHSHCDGRMVVTIDTEDKCLLLYPQPEWDEIQARIDALPSFNKAVRRIQRGWTRRLCCWGSATSLKSGVKSSGTVRVTNICRLMRMKRSPRNCSHCHFNALPGNGAA